VSEIVQVTAPEGAAEREPALPPVPPSRYALLRLALGLAAIVAIFLAFGLGDLLLVIAVLIAMVMLHELGHFATAKWAKMKVTEYFVGFGPRLWSVRRGETEYGVKAIPAGGYVRIIGMSSLEELEPDDEPRAYRNQPFGKRIIVASAGSAMHFLIAFVLAFVALTMIGRASASTVEVQSYLAVDGGHETPAQVAGLKPGDRILAVDGHKVTSPSVLSSEVHGRVGKPVVLEVERDGATKTLTVTPVDGRTITVGGHALAPASGPPTGYLGISLGEGTTRVGPLAAIPQSFGVLWDVTHAAVTGIGHIFSPAGIVSYAHEVAHPAQATPPGSSASVQASSPANNRPESIIGAVNTATQAAHAGGLYLIEVLISINIFIGIVNMLPMLPLDGGHVVIAGYEWIRTRRGRPRYQADVAKMMPVAYAFVAFLLLLVSTSVYLDLTHPIANPFH
jgi:membrane-associated protease RseP (regulator of RpoE activity)